ncbi:serine/threonine protein kinase [Aquisphaera giovannonii]|uniref:Serine/threonine protein kinase n=1 Tax=Aquisphaera giovannonii TaxID=406548 RepID=A0A5B9WB21_9BACT|nr:hypothetical protein [Aquisphaera giovannonii]QEH37211.1 serine/threonine protein kinase [Aquisphaera giovannonii]
MAASTDGRTQGKTVKSRPRWLRALGADSPPGELEIGGRAHALREVFKHDSWAATALYEGPGGRLRIVKLHRRAPLVFLPMRWVGRWTARNEIRLLERLGELDGIPALAGAVTHGGGPPLDNAVAREFLEGHPLGAREAVPDAFFPRLRALLDEMHARRAVYVDLHKRENIIVGEASQPCLIDFQISLLWPSWMPKGALFRIFAGSDDYHLMKHWSRCRPDQCGIDPEDFRSRIPWWIRAHRFVARPVRELRRRILVRVGVRSGKGRVETEAFAEHALRDITPRERAA